jgi:hypothetical protein
MSSKQANKKFINETILQDVVETAAKIEFGTIILKIHDSSIVQMEVTEKYRFQNTDYVEKGGGI